jgi:hypothetical protein
MGNLCGKQSNNNFEGQGRTLGSAPAPATKASIPSNVASAPKRTVGGPPRTLGEGSSTNDPKAAAAAAAEVRTIASLSALDRKGTAAHKGARMVVKHCMHTGFGEMASWDTCAKWHQSAVSLKPVTCTRCQRFRGEAHNLQVHQARNNKTTTGALQMELDAQKRQTNKQVLQQAAEENRRAREADQATETRNYN